jgi:hypothetical protein
MGSVCICFKSNVSVRPIPRKNFTEAANSSSNQKLAQVKPMDFTSDSSPPHKNSAQNSLMFTTQRSSRRIEMVPKESSPTSKRMNQGMLRDVMYPDVNCTLSIKLLPKNPGILSNRFTVEAKQGLQTESPACQPAPLKIIKQTGQSVDNRQANQFREPSMASDPRPPSNKLRHLNTEHSENGQINQTKDKRPSRFSVLEKPADILNRKIPANIRERTVSMPAVVLKHPLRTRIKVSKAKEAPASLGSANLESLSPRGDKHMRLALGADSGIFEATNRMLPQKITSLKSKRSVSRSRIGPQKTGQLYSLEVDSNLYRSKATSECSGSPRLVRKRQRTSQRSEKLQLTEYLPNSQSSHLSLELCSNYLGLHAVSGLNSQNLSSPTPSTTSLVRADSLANTSTGKPTEQAVTRDTLSQGKTQTNVWHRQAELSFCAISEKSGEHSDILHPNIQRSLDMDLAE